MKKEGKTYGTGCVLQTKSAEKVVIETLKNDRLKIKHVAAVKRLSTFSLLL